MRILPKVHHMWTHALGGALLHRPNHQVVGITWGPVSLLWDHGFKQAEAERNRKP